MRQYAWIWIIFASCLLLVLLSMGHITATVLILDQAEANAHQKTVVEEHLRLALWRMDSMLTQLIAQENSSPYFFYTSFYPTERAYTRMFAEIAQGEILVPSPLLTQNSPYVLLHFQYHPNQELSSPQVPSGNMRDLAESRYVTAEQVATQSTLLQQLAQSLSYEKIVSKASLHTPVKRNSEIVLAPITQGLNNDLNEIEWHARTKNVYQASNNSAQIVYKSKGLSENVEQGVFKPFWFGEKLLLMRKVNIQNQSYVQGVWLNWSELEKTLLAEVQDLLPKAKLQPFQETLCHDRDRKLATLPVLMLPGELFSPRPPLLSSVRLSLVIAWSCVLLSILAVGLLLGGTVALSERRATFVSSVTHELRTPLTTFRMYTEMLLGGMLSSVEKQQAYLKTLQVEAERLSHLVENVLSYARIERGKVQNRLTTFGVKAFLEYVQQRFSERATLASMSFEPQLETIAPTLNIYADPTAVEQILFNLIDNACKYASSGKKIELTVLEQKEFVKISVRDYGPGFSPKQKKRLFRPFSKSAQEAAGVAPGVGLGLALSRRLARQMKGDLWTENTEHPGASFVLLLLKN